MRVSIIPQNSLDERLKITLSERVMASDHAFDNGPCKLWSTPSYSSNLYAVIETQLQEPIGILYAGGQVTKIDVAWWLDSRYREKGYGSEAIDLFATYLKLNGVSGVGHISIDTFQGKYHEASCKLVARFKAHFS